MTPWYTDHRYGLGFTVEFGWSPSTWFLTKQGAAGRSSRAMGGRFTSLTASNPRSSVDRPRHLPPGPISGWAYDPDRWTTHVRYRRLPRRSPHPVVGGVERHHRARTVRSGITGEHGFAFLDDVAPGRHTWCLTFTNVGAGHRQQPLLRHDHRPGLTSRGTVEP